MKNILTIFSLLIIASFLAVPPAQAQTPTPVVHAVLFYSPNCGHCHYVIENTFPPLIEQYGSQLQIVGIDVTQPDGQKLFLAALQMFGLDQSGVPFLVIGNVYLIGSADIPEQLPGLIETYFAQGGMDWPAIPGLQEALGITETAAPQPNPETGAAPEAAPATLALPENQPLTWQQKFARDPLGNSIAVITLVLMMAAVLWAGVQLQKKEKKKNHAAIQLDWGILFLCMMGLGVAGYLAYVETAHVTAVCGPVGDCNTVQQSAYARLFGVLPIGVLGMLGYIAIALAWLTARYTKGDLAHWAAASLLGFSGFGTLFSIYLTFLEPFVIGATCAWCITSATLITIIMVISLRPAKIAMEKLGWK